MSANWCKDALLLNACNAFALIKIGGFSNWGEIYSTYNDIHQICWKAQGTSIVTQHVSLFGKIPFQTFSNYLF